MSAAGSALRKSATTVATAASSLKQGSRTAIRNAGVVIAGPLIKSVRGSFIPQSGFCRVGEGPFIRGYFAAQVKRCEQQGPERKHVDGDDVVRREDRMGDEECQVHREVRGNQDGDLFGSPLIGTP